MSFVITAKQLSFQYGKKHAIQNFNIDINENQIIGLIGRNGSGKTTFLKLCAGLLKPTTGEIAVFAQNPVNNLKVLEDIVFTHNEVIHKASLTLETIIEDFTMFYPQFDSSFAYRLIEYFSLSRHAKYSSLSQGMTSVFHFICGISARASLTLLDEPVLGIDLPLRKKIYDVLLRDYMEHPRTIIISSHILSELEELLSEFLIIDAGQVLLYKSPDEIRTMAYRVDGTKEAVSTFASNRPVLYDEYNTTGSFAVMDCPCDEAAKSDSRKLNLVISGIRPEELYLYKTNHGKGMDIECLWENQNL